MKTILNSRRDRYLAKFSIFLITLALIVGMVGCTEEDPFGEDLEIYDWYDLDAVRSYKYRGGHHTLMNDLDSETDGYNELAGPAAHRGKGWDPIGTSSAPFKGSFDGQDDKGQDHTIEGLFIKRPDEDYVGLFGSVKDGGEIKNVNLVNVDVTGDRRVGGLVGENSGTVSNSFSSGSVTGSWEVGGLVGENQFEGTVSDHSHFTGNVTSEEGLYIGGLVGKNDGGTVEENCNSTGSASGNENVGGLVGGNTGTVSNSHSTVSVSGNEKVGGLVGENIDGTVSKSYSKGSVTGKNGVGVGGLVGINDGGTVSDSYSTGIVTGTADYVGGLVGGNYDFATVSNCYSNGGVTGDKNVGGLVGGSYEESTVSNSYSTGSVTGDVAVGGLVGYSYKSIVSNSHYNYDKVRINGQDEVLINDQNVITIGALFDKDFKEFEECLDNGKVLDINGKLSQDEDGYYVVNNVSDFKQLLAFGQDDSLKFRLKTDLDLATEPNFYIPYFAGEFDGNGHKISNLSFDFNFVCNVGLFGCLAPGGRVTKVDVEKVNITGANFVGGLVGNNWEGTVRDSHSTGSVTGKDDVGGLVGSNDAGTVGNIDVGIVEENCNSKCTVTGNWHVGGLVGCNYEEGTVSHSYSTGSVFGNRRVGGLVGRNMGTVERSYSTGSVNGWVPGSVTVGDVVGGLVGGNMAIVRESCSTGSVSGDDSVGGLVGANSGEVSNSYSTTGSVIGDHDVGGLVGYNTADGKVNSTYSTGMVTSVTGDKYVGGLVGKNAGDASRISRSFWDTDTSRKDTSDGGIGKTNTDMKIKATFTAWSIIDVTSGQPPNTDFTWNIVEGEYPFLSRTPVS